MTDDVGSLVSQFVEERVDSPEPTEVDLWCEAVYASLFSVAFEVVIRLKDAKASPEALERETNDIVEMICNHAVPWVRERLNTAAQQYTSNRRIRVEFDEGPLMRNRLVMYFTEAYDVMADREYIPEVARSHSCFAILRQSLAQLGREGLMEPDEAITVLRKIFDGCEDMSREIAEALERKESE